MTETKSSIKKKLVVYGVLTCVIFVIPFYSAMCPPFIKSEIQGEWFQRSGSLMVVLGAFVEYRLILMGKYFNIVGTVFDMPFIAPESYNKYYNTISFLILSGIVIGTLIWGYGDIPFKNA